MNKLIAILSGAGKAVLFAVSVGMFAPAQATIIVDHSNGGIVNGTSWTNMGGTNYTVWDDFVLTSAASLNSISYFTANLRTGMSANYTLMIGTAAGKSDVFSTVIANSTATRKAVAGAAQIDASFTALKLNAGTYWLTFNSADDLYGSANVAGASLSQIGNGTNAIRTNSASSFILSGANAVPEPGSIALLGLGLCGLAVFRRKGRK